MNGHRVSLLLGEEEVVRKGRFEEVMQAVYDRLERLVSDGATKGEVTYTFRIWPHDNALAKAVIEKALEYAAEELGQRAYTLENHDGGVFLKLKGDPSRDSDWQKLVTVNERLSDRFGDELLDDSGVAIVLAL